MKSRISDIVNTICEILDEMEPSKKVTSYKELITFVQDRPGHDMRYAIDAGKIENELGWVPKETFPSGIRRRLLGIWKTDSGGKHPR